jgi:hypothetical protein
MQIFLSLCTDNEPATCRSFWVFVQTMSLLYADLSESLYRQWACYMQIFLSLCTDNEPATCRSFWVFVQTMSLLRADHAYHPTSNLILSLHGNGNNYLAGYLSSYWQANLKPLQRLTAVTTVTLILRYGNTAMPAGYYCEKQTAFSDCATHR